MQAGPAALARAGCEPAGVRLAPEIVETGLGGGVEQMGVHRGLLGSVGWYP